MKQLPAQRLRVNPQIAFAQCLEQKAHGLKIRDESVLVQPQETARNGWICQMAFAHLFYAHGGTHIGIEGRLILDDVETTKDIQIFGHRLIADVHAVNISNIPLDRFIGNGG